MEITAIVGGKDVEEAMENFAIRVSEVYRVSSEFEDIIYELTILENKIDDVVSGKSFVDAAGKSKNSIYGYINDVKNEKSKINLLKNQLDSIVNLYESAENKIKVDIENERAVIEKIYGIIGNVSAESVDAVFTGYDENIFMKYWDVLSDYIENKAAQYMEAVQESENAAELVVNWYEWFMDDIYRDFDTIVSVIQDLEEERTFKKPDILKDMGKFFNALSSGGVLIDIAKDIKKAYESGDEIKASKKFLFEIYKKAVKEGNKYLDKIDNLKYLGVDKQAQSVLLGTIITMPQKFVDVVREYAENGTGTKGAAVTEVIFGSLVESAYNVIKPVYMMGTAVAYPVISEVCEVFGYDMVGEYERLTGKTGLDAVFALQKEIWVDIVYDGVKKEIGGWIDNLYEFAGNAGTWITDKAQKGWQCWKSGIQGIFGGW